MPAVWRRKRIFFFFFALLRETDCSVLDPWTRIEGGHGGGRTKSVVVDGFDGDDYSVGVW
jgi:hypothetical protein